MTLQLESRIYNQMIGWRVELLSRLEKAKNHECLGFMIESNEKDLATVNHILDELER